MQASDSKPETPWLSWICGVAIAAASLPRLWGVLTCPIDKGTVYTGMITVVSALSLLLWVLLSIVALTITLWTHFKRRALRRQAWAALLAGEAFFVAMLFITGAVIEHGLEGALSCDASSIVILTGAVLGCAWGVRETLRSGAGSQR